MKVRVVTSFNDKTEGFINRPINEVFECSESRAKDLIELGYVKEAVERGSRGSDCRGKAKA